VTTSTTDRPARHGLTRGQYVAVGIGVVVILLATFFILLALTMRPNLQGTVTITDGKTTRPLAGASVTLVQKKYGAVKTFVTDKNGHYQGRAEVDTYHLRVTNCPYMAHGYVTLSLGQVVTRNIPCLSKRPQS
jgi:hypothetical protein